MTEWTKLSCDEVEPAISWFLDDELDPEYALEVEQHLRECGRCQETLSRKGRDSLELPAYSRMKPEARRPSHAVACSRSS